MGMYTECRGWIEINDMDFNTEKFEDLMGKVEDISERASQCVSCTVFNIGFNWSPYIFIGGSIKNYDDDWNKFLNFLLKNLKVSEYKIETRYEEEDDWTKFDAILGYSVC